ncbi:MAG: SPOR domain-containing protein [Betaproteobacteria bacterium]|nr:SPOR domain-containing protein [Betaproteobacteria bacterium]
MRLLFLILLLANVAAFGYIRYAESRAGADAQIALLQISPEKVKLLKPGAKPSAEPGDMGAAAVSQPQPLLVCLEWGSFAAEDATRAAAALARLEIGDKVSRRETGDSYWVYIPPLKTKAEADKKASEVMALGIGDFLVVQDDDQYRFAVSLGVFKTEEAANGYLAQLRQKGVRSAVVGPRGTKGSLFVIRDPGDAVALKIAGLKTEFPAAQLKATACADALAARN